VKMLLKSMYSFDLSLHSRVAWLFPSFWLHGVTGGKIPDAALIHAARKRRQQAREMGGANFIPLTEENSIPEYVIFCHFVNVHVVLRVEWVVIIESTSIMCLILNVSRWSMETNVNWNFD
jgi:hypothetical protein